MKLRSKRGWELPESRVTPEAVFLNRRRLLQAAGIVAAAGAGGYALLHGGTPAQAAPTQPLAPMPAPHNDAFQGGRPLTPEKDATTYNNYYEFGLSKSIYPAAQSLPLRPWTLKIDGMVEKPLELDIDDLLKTMSLEERIYRHRCVEAWSMVVPWTGFPLAALVKRSAPTAGAKYLMFETASLPSVMPGLRQSWYSWPYQEGCTIAEAMNEMPFMVTGLYGKAVPPQNGAPLRVVFPWKYGFKSGKSLVRITFTDKRPVSFWEKIQPQEYGFWANVNPEVPHPRWSQATERDLGTGDRIATQLFNGYAPQVANLYVGLEKERLYA